MNLKALLFDVDGTLAETERDGHRVAFNRAFEAHGLPWHWDEDHYGDLLQVTGGRERIAHFARTEDPRWLAQADSADRIVQIHRDKTRQFATLAESGAIRLRPGLEALVRQAQAAGVELAIVTTTSRSNVEVLLKANFEPALRQAFRLYVTGEDVRRKKPDPECYHLALRELGLSADEALAVEDSPNGLRAASAAGLLSLVVPSAYFRTADFSGAALVARTFTEVTLPMLRRIAAGAGP